jgi:hypothetical protein
VTGLTAGGERNGFPVSETEMIGDWHAKNAGRLVFYIKK